MENEIEIPQIKIATENILNNEQFKNISEDEKNELRIFLEDQLMMFIGSKLLNEISKQDPNAQEKMKTLNSIEDLTNLMSSIQNQELFFQSAIEEFTELLFQKNQ